MWNHLVTPTIDYREGMKEGFEDTSSKEVNGGKYWLSKEAMAVDGVVAVVGL